MLLTALIILNTILLGALIIFLLKFKESMPDIQQVLDDVGASISSQLSEIFSKPAVSKAMSVLGKKSGEVRANKALRNKAANALLGQYPSVGLILDQLDMTPVEGLQLMKDPLIGPIIQGALSGGLKGFSQGQKKTKQSSGELGRV